MRGFAEAGFNVYKAIPCTKDSLDLLTSNWSDAYVKLPLGTLNHSEGEGGARQVSPAER